MNSLPVFGDIAHLGHIELLTPKLDESLAFFTRIMGLHESGRQGDSIFLRAWGDYECFTLQLTGAVSSGLGHMAFRAKSQMVLEQLVRSVESSGVRGEWQANNFGHGPAYRFPSPDGHHVEIYYETEKLVPVMTGISAILAAVLASTCAQQRTRTPTISLKNSYADV